MSKVYVVSNITSASKGPVALYADLEEALFVAEHHNERGFDCYIYKQAMNTDGDVIETLVSWQRPVFFLSTLTF